jgi:hypothetical protein
MQGALEAFVVEGLKTAIPFPPARDGQRGIS